jgi:TRAP-type C4-dicarboxylate transport system substrate-binding protein
MNRNFKILSALFLAAAVTVITGGDAAFAAAAATAKWTPENPLVIDNSSGSRPVPEDGNYNICNGTSKIIEERLGGAIRFEFKGGGQLATNDIAQSQGVQSGTIGSCTITLANVEADIPQLALFFLPYLVDNDQAATEFLANWPGMEQMKALIEKKYNSVVLSIYHTGMRTMLNRTRSISSVADMKNLKMRSMESPVYLKMFNLLGANGTLMSWADAVIAFQQGTVDGCENPINAHYLTGVYKIAKYISTTNHSMTANCFMMNRDMFESLTAEQQEALRQAAKESTALWSKKVVQENQDLLNLMESEGAVITRNPDMDEFKKTLHPIFGEFRDVVGAEIFDSAMDYLKIAWK